MLTIVRNADIFASTMQTITNPVNCVGVMGKGLALTFKLRFPHHFFYYKSLCSTHRLRPGILATFEEEDRNILLFPTKDHWRNPSRIEYIEEGLKYLAQNYKELGIQSLTLPPLSFDFVFSRFASPGCGLGGLNVKDVSNLCQKYLEPLPIPVELYIP